jgi:hypothetical protein
VFGPKSSGGIVSNIFGSGKQVLDAMGQAIAFNNDDDILSSDSKADLSTTKKQRMSVDKKEGFAKVHINFETHPASDLDSVKEVFTVFFNMTRNHYEEMHHHGVLCDLALHWLHICTAEAVDAANGEVNAKSVWQYIDKDQSQSDGLFGGVRSLGTQLAKIARVSTNTGLQPLQSENLYEPILIEYLVLRERVLRLTPFDKVPRSWRRIRGYAYQDSRAKIEALWAFIQAHEHCLHASQVVERFPQLIKCIQEVVAQAKLDLENLELVTPGRFFYTKHLLALRTLMNNRLKKLGKFIDGGSLSPADGEKLMDHFRERLTIVDFYTPNSLRDIAPGDPRLDKLNVTNHHAFAWSKVELPPRRSLRKLGEVERPEEHTSPNGHAPTMGRSNSMTMGKSNSMMSNASNSGNKKKKKIDLRSLNEGLSPEMKIPGAVSPDPKENAGQSKALANPTPPKTSPKNTTAVVTIPEEKEERPDSRSMESVNSGEGAKDVKVSDHIPDPSANLISSEQLPKEAGMTKGIVEDSAESGLNAPHTGWTPLSLEPQERIDDVPTIQDS